MKSISRILFYLALSALVSACTASPPGPNTKLLRETLASLNLANPDIDAARSVSQEDFRPIGINGFACIPPGEPNVTVERLAKDHGLRCLAGTTDALESEHYGEMRDQAIEYGIHYNLALVQLVRNRERSNNSFKPNPLRSGKRRH